MPAPATPVLRPPAPPGASDLEEVPGPVEVAVLSDSPVIRTGVQALAAGHASRVRVTPHAWTPRADPPPAHVVLVDTGRRATRATHLASRAGAVPVVALGRGLDEREVRRLLDGGCAAHLDYGTGPEELVTTLLEVARSVGADVSPWWPGREHGLSRREAQLLTLVCRGATNQDIAAELDLTLNTVKSYVRSAYRKVGARRRPEAVRWGIEHGLLGPAPPALRTAGA